MSNKLVILNFHGVGDPGEAIDDGEIPYWISKEFFYEILDLCKKYTKKVMFTFDDGNASDVEICAPALKSIGCSGLFFPLAGRVNQPGYLTEADIRSIVEMGSNIGSHGFNHTDWRYISGPDVQLELYEARNVLAKISGLEVTEAAVPFGHYNRAALQYLRKARYRKIYTSDGGAANPHLWLQPRYSVRCDMTIDDIDGFLTGSESLKKKIVRLGSKFKKKSL